MSIYDYSVKTRKGDEMHLSDLKGNVVERFAPTVKPEEMENKIKELL